MSSNPSKAVQKMIVIAKERANGDQALENYLMVHAKDGMGATAFMRKVCSLKEDDWELYHDARDYEFIKNRSQEDKNDKTPYIMNGGLEDEYAVLTTRQFERLAMAMPSAKRLDYKTYQFIRFHEYYYEDKRCPIGQT